ncbi:Putative Zn-dependent protease, contains TPR repeats [Cohaesibacter sp. ES.047]|uniref:M48 family metalloprotease n=1 Tax=Cohaesibacter sp. ES.047 TaxID=1798205 RepID=UPI000BB79628|nr:M48 family metalloprotease [Cohaesibacter sp. ES.047]SNY93787.1 Putative Zn-dependent protease, contains TPR repeats [Cohaesibacter sp. ES.047]
MFLGFGIKSLRKLLPVCTPVEVNRTKQRILRSASHSLLAALIALGPILHAASANAQNSKLRLVRDAETEELIRDYARPILKVAGLKPGNIRIHLVNDSRMNAFVVDGKRIFINTGTLIAAKTPNEVIGILAHETGHIAGGHLVRLRRAVENAQTMAVVGMLLGAGAAAAGAATGNRNAAAVGSGIMMGSPTIAQNSLLNYARTEEIAADRAAIRYLERSGQSAKGMLTTFQRFADQDLFSSRYVDPYIQSHPLPRERISQIERLAKSSKHYQKKDSPALQFRHDMVRAKLSAFTQRAKRVMRKYKGNDLPSQYARAIVTYRLGSHKKALRLVDSLIKARPDFPYFWELKGQILLETGSGDQAIAPLNQAVNMHPNEGLLRVMLGQALLSAKRNRNPKAAISHLRRGLQNDPDQPIGYRLLAQAYDQIGKRAEAEMATANGYFAQGDISSAKAMATRAQKKLKRGSPEWVQAQDIIDYRPPKI